MQCSTASLGTIPAVTASATHDYHDGAGVAGYRSNSASTSDEEMRRSIFITPQMNERAPGGAAKHSKPRRVTAGTAETDLCFRSAAQGTPTCYKSHVLVQTVVVVVVVVVVVAVVSVVVVVVVVVAVVAVA